VRFGVSVSLNIRKEMLGDDSDTVETTHLAPKKN
jgi:hypothetical protein